jgi:hypothetical protein
MIFLRLKGLDPGADTARGESRGAAQRTPVLFPSTWKHAMADVGVALRHDHQAPQRSTLTFNLPFVHQTLKKRLHLTSLSPRSHFLRPCMTRDGSKWKLAATDPSAALLVLSFTPHASRYGTSNIYLGDDAPLLVNRIHVICMYTE